MSTRERPHALILRRTQAEQRRAKRVGKVERAVIVVREEEVGEVEDEKEEEGGDQEPGVLDAEEVDAEDVEFVLKEC